jgi:hypothetical protein
MDHLGISSVKTKRISLFFPLNQNMNVTKILLKELMHVNLISKEKNYVKEPSILLKMKYILIMV